MSFIPQMRLIRPSHIVGRLIKAVHLCPSPTVSLVLIKASHQHVEQTSGGKGLSGAVGRLDIEITFVQLTEHPMLVEGLVVDQTPGPSAKIHRRVS